MELSGRFDRALVFASEAHRRQIRKTSGAPYVSHVLGVCALVLDDGGSEDEAIAALLHDVVEDQGCRFAGGPRALAERIAAEFGAEVGRLVQLLTENPTDEVRKIRDRRERWRAHKLNYIRQIGACDLPVRRISCADSIYNVTSLITGYRVMGEKLWAKFRTREASDQLWAYSEISRAFLAAGGTALALELEDAVDRLHRVVGLPRS